MAIIIFIAATFSFVEEKKKPAETHRSLSSEGQRPAGYSRTQIWPCAKWVKWTSNVHNDRTYKEHSNLKIRKHVKSSCSGTKLIY